ncbi:MAG: peroxiredoxin [Verrucomicrobia bacterium]|nr:peroxiredoxin [Verrucomicrobiota bacterium]
MKKILVGAVVTTACGLLLMKAMAADTKLKLGDPIPDVAGTTQDNRVLELSQEGAHGYLLVYFYPKAMTPGCTAQACSLRDAYADLIRHDLRVIGVSLDSVASQKRFQEKDHLPFPLIADTDRKVTGAFGVPIIMGVAAARQAYLFKDGRLVWFDTHASTGKQARDVLAVVEKSSS